jgi:UDP-N-acetyl-D-glucosamine dehydrogenase
MSYGTLQPSRKAVNAVLSSVVVVGQGYVGLPLAMRAVEVGHKVVGYDTETRRVKRLAAGDSYVEDVSNEQIVAALGTGRYQPTDRAEDLDGFEVALITVPGR